MQNEGLDLKYIHRTLLREHPPPPPIKRVCVCVCA